MTQSSLVTSNMRDKVSLFQSLAYAMPTMAVYFLYGPISILQGIYVKYFGVSLATIATILFVARIFDAVTDPIIGYLSDRYYFLKGSRKPFVAVGGILFIISSYFLYVPGGVETLYAVDPNHNISTTYFFVWFVVFYLAWTIFEIPHLAWGGELAPDSKSKSKVFSLRIFGIQIGQLVFFAIPLLPIFENSGFTPQTLAWSVVTAGVFMVPMLYVCIHYTPSGRANHISHNSSTSKPPIRFVLSSITSNASLLIFLLATLLIGTGVGMWFALIFIFADSYLGLGNKLPQVYVFSFGISTLLLGIWYRIANRWGKKTVWVIGATIMTIGMICTAQLSLGDSHWLLLLLSMILIYCGLGAVNISAPSLLSDIIDYGQWKFGLDLGATYFSLYTLVVKASIAIGGAFGFAIVGWYDFSPSLVSQSARAVYGLYIAVAWIPAVLTLISIAIIILVPISIRRHAIIICRHRRSGGY